MYIIDSDLPITKNQVGECFNCKKVTYIRPVEVLSAFGGMNRGFYPLCFRCFAPRFHWQNDRLKEGTVYETPCKEFRAELEAAEQGLHPISESLPDLRPVVLSLRNLKENS